MLLEEGRLKPKKIDKLLIKSILSSSETAAKAAKSVILSDLTATMIFKEMYDAIRQLGEIKWLLLGYEPYGRGAHEISIELLMEDKDIAFTHLDRFRRLRNDANYQGRKIFLEQAKEILSFWEGHCEELLVKLKQENEHK